jgi:hypothetical protein
MLVCHACDRPLCCRVEHLFLGSPVDNAQDMLRKKRAHDRRGENAGGVKLTEALVREIRAHAGSSTEVAPLYGVTARTVRRIRRGDRWGHIA